MTLTRGLGTEMSDTPETDANEAWPASSQNLKCSSVVPSAIARKLERERDEAIKRYEDISAVFEHGADDEWLPCTTLAETVARILKERNKAQEAATNYFAKIGELQDQLNETRNKMADALQEVDLRTLDFERMKQERDELQTKLERFKMMESNYL